MAPIPGIPGASEPSFRTGERGWMSLDQVVHEAVAWLDTDGIELSPYVVKATVQLTRRLLDGGDELVGDALYLRVQLQLRQAGVLLQPGQVERIVRVYASVVAILDIRDTSELGT